MADFVAISSREALRSLYRDPTRLVLDKAIGVIDEAAARFIAQCPLVVLATTDGTRADASPRGGEPGFVKVIDQHRLAFADLTGNNRLDSFSNLIANPTIGMLLIIPGMNETLRIRGSAVVTQDPELSQLCAIGGRIPKTVVIVEVEECYLHCGASFKRGAVWDTSTWPAQGDRVSGGEILATHAEVGAAASVVQDDLDAYYDDVMWEMGGEDGSASQS